MSDCGQSTRENPEERLGLHRLQEGKLHRRVSGCVTHVWHSASDWDEGMARWAKALLAEANPAPRESCPRFIDKRTLRGRPEGGQGTGRGCRQDSAEPRAAKRRDSGQMAGAGSEPAGGHSREETSSMATGESSRVPGEQENKWATCTLGPPLEPGPPPIRGASGAAALELCSRHRLGGGWGSPGAELPICTFTRPCAVSLVACSARPAVRAPSHLIVTRPGVLEGLVPDVAWFTKTP